MRKTLLILAIGLILVPAAGAVPNLQLFISGATYDTETETWIISTPGDLDLYVISANYEHDDVIVAMALSGFSEMENPDGVVSVSGFGGPAIDDWTWGYSPLASAPGWDAGEDLPPHGVYPTWFAEAHTGYYGLGDMVGDVQPGPDFWDPSLGGPGPANRLGEFKVFSLSISAPLYTGIHFDAYTLDGDVIDDFAPFSHDAGATIVPEPGTIVLMGTGLIGIGIFRFRRKKK
jgi:hypothetical protein